MGTKFPTIAISGWNQNPPSDDGSQSAANQVTWAKTVSKIGNPLKTYADAVNSAVATALSTSCRIITTSDATVAGDHWRTVQIGATTTSAITVSLMDAVTAANGYIVTVANQSAFTCTIDRVTASNTIQTVTAAISILPLSSITFVVNAAANGYIILNSNGAQVASQSISTNLTLGTGATVTLSAAAAISLGSGAAIANGYLNARTGSNILTLELLATGGAAATSDNPITSVFRNSTISNGSLTGLSITAAVTLAISSGSTLGCANSETVRVHVGLMANGELFAWTATVGALTSIVKPDLNGFVTTVAEGGAGGADTAQTFYSTTLRSNQPWRYIGYAEVVSGATAGQWSSVSKIVNWQPGVPLPGDFCHYSYTAYTGAASGNTVMPGDDTIPQIGEGDQFMTVSHTMKSALNVLEAYALAYLSPATAAGINLGMFKNGASDAIVAGTTNPLLGTGLGIGILKSVSKAGATTPAVYTFRAGNGSGYADTFNGASGSRLFGGAINSYFEVLERQG